MIKHHLCTNKQCAHEWDGDSKTCDWCGSPGRTIELLRPWSMESMLCLVKKMKEEMEQKTAK